MKYYGVKIGRVPGVYTTWDEAKLQVNGFPHATHSSFKSCQEARDYVTPRPSSSSSSSVVTAASTRDNQSFSRPRPAQPRDKRKWDNTLVQNPTELTDSVEKKPRHTTLALAVTVMPPWTQKMHAPTSWLLQFDGGSRGNPGPGGSGAVLYQLIPREETTVHPLRHIVWKGYRYWPAVTTTNNVAEYEGLVLGLEYCSDKLPSSDVLAIEGDSLLVINQIKRVWQCNHPEMKVRLLTVRRLLKGKKATLTHIPRKLNAVADALANVAMDTQCSESEVFSLDVDDSLH